MSRHLLRIGELVVNTLSARGDVGRSAVQLSVKEFQLLATLAAEPERVFSKQELLETVWGFRARAAPARSTHTPAGCGRSWPSHSDAAWIVNVWGDGYRVCTPE